MGSQIYIHADIQRDRQTAKEIDMHLKREKDRKQREIERYLQINRGIDTD